MEWPTETAWRWTDWDSNIEIAESPSYPVIGGSTITGGIWLNPYDLDSDGFINFGVSVYDQNGNYLTGTGSSAYGIWAPGWQVAGTAGFVLPQEAATIRFQIGSAYTGRLGVDAFWWGYKGNSTAEATYQFNGNTIFSFPYWSWSPTYTDYVSVEWAP